MDLFNATTLLEAALTSIKQSRDEFEETKTTAQALAKAWGTDGSFKQKRTSRKKRMFDELSEHVLQTPNSNLRRRYTLRVST